MTTTYKNATIFLDGKPIATGPVDVAAGPLPRAEARPPTSGKFEATFEATLKPGSAEVLRWAMEELAGNAPDIVMRVPNLDAAGRTTKADVLEMCEAVRAGLAMAGGFRGRVLPAPEMVAHLPDWSDDEVPWPSVAMVYA